MSRSVPLSVGVCASAASSSSSRGVGRGGGCPGLGATRSVAPRLFAAVGVAGWAAAGTAVFGVGTVGESDGPGTGGFAGTALALVTTICGAGITDFLIAI